MGGIIFHFTLTYIHEGGLESRFGMVWSEQSKKIKIFNVFV